MFAGITTAVDAADIPIIQSYFEPVLTGEVNCSCKKIGHLINLNRNYKKLKGRDKAKKEVRKDNVTKDTKLWIANVSSFRTKSQIQK